MASVATRSYADKYHAAVLFRFRFVKWGDGGAATDWAAVAVPDVLLAAVGFAGSGVFTRVANSPARCTGQPAAVRLFHKNDDVFLPLQQSFDSRCHVLSMPYRFMQAIREIQITLGLIQPVLCAAVRRGVLSFGQRASDAAVSASRARGADGLPSLARLAALLA